MTSYQRTTRKADQTNTGSHRRARGASTPGLIGCSGHELARLACEVGPLICGVLGYREPLLHWPTFAGVGREARSTRGQRAGAGAGQFDDEPGPAPMA